MGALDASPAPLAVVGGSAAGCELAQGFARLGSTMTIIEGLDRILNFALHVTSP